MRAVLRVVICIGFIIAGFLLITDTVADPKSLYRGTKQRRMTNMVGEPLMKLWHIFLGAAGVLVGIMGIVTMFV